MLSTVYHYFVIIMIIIISFVKISIKYNMLVMINFSLNALKIQKVIREGKATVIFSLLKLPYPLGSVTYIHFSPAKLIVEPNDE